MNDPVPGLTVYAAGSTRTLAAFPGPHTQEQQLRADLWRKPGQQHIGRAIRRRRVRLGLTQVELAEMVGVLDTYVAHVEAGRIAYPATHINRFALFLDTTVDLLRDDARMLEAHDEAA